MCLIYMINNLNNNNTDDKKLMHIYKLRISIIVKQASVYKNRIKTAWTHIQKNKIVCPLPQSVAWRCATLADCRLGDCRPQIQTLKNKLIPNPNLYLG